MAAPLMLLPHPLSISFYFPCLPFDPPTLRLPTHPHVLLLSVLPVLPQTQALATVTFAVQCCLTPPTPPPPPAIAPILSLLPHPHLPC